MKHDSTFEGASEYGSDNWISVTLGRSRDWLVKHRSALEAEGFPPKDPLTGHTIKADVKAWIAKRRRISDPKNGQAHVGSDIKAQRIDLSAF